MIKKKIIYGCEQRGDAYEPYLTRWTLIKTKWFQLCLHKFHRSDADDLHDHPWKFYSFILWRGYYEETETGKRRVYPLDFLYRSAEHRHRVELVDGKPAVTLVLMRKYERSWGFWVNGVWEYWETYFKRNGC